MLALAEDKLGAHYLNRKQLGAFSRSTAHEKHRCPLSQQGGE